MEKKRKKKPQEETTTTTKKQVLKLDLQQMGKLPVATRNGLIYTPVTPSYPAHR